jgi:hypothetical protein
VLQRDCGAHEVTKTHVAEAYDASSFARSESMGLFLNIDRAVVESEYILFDTPKYQTPKHGSGPTDVVRHSKKSSTIVMRVLTCFDISFREASMYQKHRQKHLSSASKRPFPYGQQRDKTGLI